MPSYNHCTVNNLNLRFRQFHGMEEVIGLIPKGERLLVADGIPPRPEKQQFLPK
jgi:hypothetical protein